MKSGTLGHKILEIHNQIRQQIGDIARIGIALYDVESDQLSTFIHSTDGNSPLEHYQARLSDVASLNELAEKRKSRIIDDLTQLSGSSSQHTQRILAAGFRSSYTSPLYTNDKLVGFLFFDSDQPGYFRKHINVHLDTYAQLIAATISNDLNPIRTLKGAVATAREFSRHHDEETACHVSRVAHYSKIIALELATEHDFSDEDVEFVFQFAGLHDIGKIAIPDQILLKPGRLTSEEYDIAKTHVTKGIDMADVMIREFGLDGVHHVEMLRNIILCHHERYDGEGYPNGLKGTSIPLEGRIVAISDVFDALTSNRPYKKAWPMDKSLEYLIANSGIQFDPDCVDSMERNFDKILETHARCNETPF